MKSLDQRNISVSKFAEDWRKLVGQPAALEQLNFKYSMGPGAGPDITLQLAHPKTEVLRQAGEELAATLNGIAGVEDVVDGFAPGIPGANPSTTSSTPAIPFRVAANSSPA